MAFGAQCTLRVVVCVSFRADDTGISVSYLDFLAAFRRTDGSPRGTPLADFRANTFEAEDGPATGSGGHFRGTV